VKWDAVIVDDDSKPKEGDVSPKEEC